MTVKSYCGDDKLCRMRVLSIASVIATSLCTVAPLARAADCASLQSLKLSDTTITLAQRVTTGSIVVPPETSVDGLPAFCRVAGVIRPTTDSAIRFEVWMPESAWNERFLGVGNGGFAGVIGYGGLAANLRRGFATAGTDTGHDGEGEDASWAYQHPEKIKDFGWRGVHLTTERAKQVVQAFYGRPARRSYFDSCSDGGREALMEAQRFPEDYDGILAGAPANNWTGLLSSGIDVTQVTTGDPAGYISSLKLPAITRAALAACDAQDGVKDGFINNPAQCHFNPKTLLCKDGDSPDCLTAPQVRSLEKFYQGGTNSRGESLMTGYAMGGEWPTWKDWVTGHGPGGASGLSYVQNFFRYMVYDDPKWGVLTANVDDAARLAKEKMGPELDAVNPDLSGFAARGGRLILYHGWSDPAISPWNAITYYESVRKQMGAEKAEGFVRLYMVPGMDHCAGGPGPNAFGQFGLPEGKGPGSGILHVLEDWVETNAPAKEIVAAKFQGEGKAATVKMTRPLCPYPQVAAYKGAGSTDDAANFVCRKE